MFCKQKHKTNTSLPTPAQTGIRASWAEFGGGVGKVGGNSHVDSDCPTSLCPLTPPPGLSVLQKVLDSCWGKLAGDSCQHFDNHRGGLQVALPWRRKRSGWWWWTVVGTPQCYPGPGSECGEGALRVGAGDGSRGRDDLWPSEVQERVLD